MILYIAGNSSSLLEELVKILKITRGEIYKVFFTLSSFFLVSINSLDSHCVKSVQMRSFSGPYFSVFGLTSRKYRPEKIRVWTLFTQFAADG